MMKLNRQQTRKWLEQPLGVKFFKSDHMIKRDNVKLQNSTEKVHKKASGADTVCRSYLELI